MLVKLIKEVYYLSKFQSAISRADLGAASKYLGQHKAMSDMVEKELSSVMTKSKHSILKQKEMMDNLIGKL